MKCERGSSQKKVANKGPSVRSTRESVTQVTFTAVKQSPKGRGPRRAAPEIKWGEGREGPRARAIMDASDGGRGEEGRCKKCTLSDSETQHWSSSPAVKLPSVRLSTPGGDSDPACGREPAW